MPVHLTLPVLRSRPSYTPSAPPAGFHSVPMSSRLTKKSLVSASGFVVKTPCLEPPTLVPSMRMPPMRTVISGAVSVRSCALVDQHVLRADADLALDVVAEAVGDRLEHREGFDVRLVLPGVHSSGREGNLHLDAGVLRGLLDARAAREHDQVGKGDFLPAGLRSC